MAAIRPTTKGCATARFWISRQGYFTPAIMPFSAPESVRVYKTCPLLRRGREEGRRQGCRRGGGCFPLTGGRLRGRAVWQPAGAGDSGYFPSRLRRAGKFRNDDVVFSLRVAPVSGGGHGIACERIPRDSDGKASPPCGGDSGMTMVWVLLPFVLRGFAGGRA